MTQGLREHGKHFLFHTAVDGDLKGETCLLPVSYAVAGWLCCGEM
jgi:hypothetical protein